MLDDSDPYCKARRARLALTSVQTYALPPAC